MFNCSVLKDQSRLPPLGMGGFWSARPWYHKPTHKDGSSLSPTAPLKPCSTTTGSRPRASRYDFRSYNGSGLVSDSQLGGDDMWESMGAENITELLTNIRNGFTGTVKTIAQSHKQLQRRVAELEQLCERLRLDKEAEEFHSQRLTELLSRETRKTEEGMRRMEETQRRNQTLAAELAELENLYFRSTELASGAQVDSNFGLTEDQAENEQKIQELEAQVHFLELNLSLKEPLVQQLQTQIEQLMLDNEMLRAREDCSPETVHMSRDGSKGSHRSKTEIETITSREAGGNNGTRGGVVDDRACDKQQGNETMNFVDTEPRIELEVKIR